VILGSDFLYEHGAVMDFLTENIRTAKDGETKCYKFQEDDAGRFKRERGTNSVLYNNSEEAHFNHIQLQETGEIRELGFNASTAANRDVENSHKETINTGKVRDKETPRINDVLVFSTGGKKYPSSSNCDEENESLNGRTTPEYLSIVDEDDDNDKDYDDDNGYYDAPVGCMIRKEGNNTNQPFDLIDNRSASTQTISDLTQRIDALLPLQQTKLAELLDIYKGSLTTKPGSCNAFEYHFVLTSRTPVSGYARSLPFLLRPVVRAQLNQMIQDGITEACSPYVNPLTIVPRPNKKPRVCVDARKIKEITVLILNGHHQCKNFYNVGFEVFTAVSMKIAVFWVVAPCSLVEVECYNPEDSKLSTSTTVPWRTIHV
jgi:hypothetical protein